MAQKESSPTSSPSSNNITYVAFSWRYIKIWTRLNEIIVQQWPIIRVQDIVTFGVSVTMTVRHVNLSILNKTRQGARGQGPLLSLCQACGGQHPNNPLLSNRGHAITPCAEALSVLASKTTADRHRQQIYSFAKTDLFNKKAAIEHRHMHCQKGNCVLYLIIHRYRHQSINSLWPGDAIWRHRTGSIFTHLMAFCLTAQAII